MKTILASLIVVCGIAALVVAAWLLGGFMKPELSFEDRVAVAMLPMVGFAVLGVGVWQIIKLVRDLL